jgi:hypothetical protein
MKRHPMTLSYSGDNRWTGTVSKNFKTPRFVGFVVNPSRLHYDPRVLSVLLDGAEQIVSPIPWLILREAQSREIFWSGIRAGSKIEVAFDELVDGVGVVLEGSLS